MKDAEVSLPAPAREKIVSARYWGADKVDLIYVESDPPNAVGREVKRRTFPYAKVSLPEGFQRKPGVVDLNPRLIKRIYERGNGPVGIELCIGIWIGMHVGFDSILAYLERREIEHELRMQENSSFRTITFPLPLLISHKPQSPHYEAGPERTGVVVAFNRGRAANAPG